MTPTRLRRPPCPLPLPWVCSRPRAVRAPRRRALQVRRGRQPFRTSIATSDARMKRKGARLSRFPTRAARPDIRRSATAARVVLEACTAPMMGGCRHLCWVRLLAKATPRLRDARRGDSARPFARGRGTADQTRRRLRAESGWIGELLVPSLGCCLLG